MNEEKERARGQRAGREHSRGRRRMLKAGALGVLAGQVSAGNAQAGNDAPKRLKRYAMVIDVRRCIGCQACSVACKSEFNVPLGVWRCWVKQAERGKIPNRQRHFLPRLCNHCEDPPCVEVCPTKSAYQREDGVNLVREERCIGCRLCVAACPYKARFSHPDKKIADKCTFCVHRVDNGVVPACVNTCQGNARIFGDLNDPNSEVARLVAREQVQVLKPELGTRPRVFYIGGDASLMGRFRKEF